MVTVMPIVVDMFGTMFKELIKGMYDLEIRGQVNTIQTIAF